MYAITFRLSKIVRILAVLTVATIVLMLPLVAQGERSSAKGTMTTGVAGTNPSTSPTTTGNITATDTITHYVFLPRVIGSDIVFFDDFSDSSSGWPHDKNYESCYFQYYNGRYRMTITKYGQECMAPNLDIPKQVNGTFSVNVRRTSDSDEEVYYGLLFGAGTDATEDHWRLLVYPDKDKRCNDKPFFWLSAKVDDKDKYFEDQCTDAIKTGNEWNELKVVRKGKNIKVYINGRLKGDYDDANYLLDQGYTLLYAISASSEETYVEFDTLMIRSSTD